MNKKEKNKNKPRNPGSWHSWKHAIFTSLSRSLSGKNTPIRSPAGCVWKDQLPEAQVPRLASHIHTQCSCITSHRQSRPRTALLGIMAPVTRDALHYFTLLSRVWNSTRRLCITLEARPFHTPCPPFLPRSTWSPCRGRRYKTEKVTAKHRQHYLTQMTSLTAQALGTVIPPQLRQQKPDFKKFSLSHARPSWSSLWLLVTGLEENKREAATESGKEWISREQ